MRRLLVPGFLAGAILLSSVVSSRVDAGYGAWTFVRGDFDGNGIVELSDAVGLLDHLFVSGSLAPACQDAADVNDDGSLGLVDPIYLLSFLFVPGSPPLPGPYPDCGLDTTPDSLGCDGPIAGCPEAQLPPDLQFAHSQDSLEFDPGLRVHPARQPITPGSFESQRFGMRPFTLFPGVSTGFVELEAAGDPILEVFALDGAPVALPLSLDATDLPLTMLLSTTGPGNGTLTATHSAGGIPDVVTIQSSLNPGLVGGELSAYPWFQTVETINADDEVLTAIDPGRYSDRSGLSYRVYIVEHRSPAEWALDNTLVDVSGGFEVGSVTGNSILDTLEAAWTVGLDAGSLVGAGYDVVYDFGLDGTLDPGDLMDGPGQERPGFSIVGDLSESGPYATADVQYSGGTFLGQKTYYPTNLGSIGPVPLVVISHGNGHDYRWYDYLGNHLASYGYVVMAHQNNTGPGIETASTTTLTNTDYLLANQDTIAGGVLSGNLDISRITWIGHSRGERGVVRAYDRLVDGTYSPAQFDAANVGVVCSIAPTMFFDVNSTDPHSVNYHLLYGAADGDVDGDPVGSWPFQVYQAAEGNAQVTYVHGASHNDFNCCGFSDGAGPALIGRPMAQIVAKSYILALVEHYVKDNPATRDYFTRHFSRFHPQGIGGNVVVANQYRDPASVPNDFIEDYQTQVSTDTSSSGGAVAFDVSNIQEGKLQDANTTFTWSGSDPFNGMTQAIDAADQTRGVVFDWSVGADRFYELEVPVALSNFSDDEYLGFRACQGTRHPETVGLGGDLDFTVTLRDADGVESSINFGSFATITEPYQRSGAGTGVGWANEFNTVRIRLTDFENDGSGIDLSEIESIRLEFGASYGSPRGRLGLDDVQVTVPY